MTLDPERYESLAGFRVALRRFLAASEAISKANGVTQQQYQALLAIRTWPAASMTVGDLAGELLLTHHAAVQLADRLAAAGLAQRAPSSADRRNVFLELTDAGAALIDTLAALHLTEVLRQEPSLSLSLRRLKRLSRGGGGEEAAAKARAKRGRH